MDDMRNHAVDERLERLETQTRDLRFALGRLEQQLEAILAAPSPEGAQGQSSRQESGPIPQLPSSPTLSFPPSLLPSLPSFPHRTYFVYSTLLLPGACTLITSALSYHHAQ